MKNLSKRLLSTSLIIGFIIFIIYISDNFLYLDEYKRYKEHFKEQEMYVLQTVQLISIIIAIGFVIIIFLLLNDEEIENRRDNIKAFLKLSLFPKIYNNILINDIKKREQNICNKSMLFITLIWILLFILLTIILNSNFIYYLIYELTSYFNSSFLLYFIIFIVSLFFELLIFYLSFFIIVNIVVRNELKKIME